MSETIDKVTNSRALAAALGIAPTVSAVIPTYNRPDMLCRAIRSIQAQTYKDWELIVVDDCSPDDGLTESAVAGFNDPRIRYSRNETNKKLPGSRNAGARLARGKFIAFLDDDDEWLPEKLEQQVEVFERSQNPSLGAVITWLYVADGKREFFPVGQEDFEGDVYEQLLLTTDLTTTGSSLMISRAVIESGIFHDEKFVAYEDYDYLVRIAKLFDVATVTEPLVRKHEDFDGARVWNPASKLAGEHRIIEKYAVELGTRRIAFAKKHMALAGTYARANNGKQTRRHIAAALRAWPLSPSFWLLLVASLVGPRPFAKVNLLLGTRHRWARIKRRFWRMTEAATHTG